MTAFFHTLLAYLPTFLTGLFTPTVITKIKTWFAKEVKVVVTKL
jgi:hypothetical protein